MEAFFVSDGQPDLNMMDPPVRVEQHGSGPKSLKTLANEVVQKELQYLPHFEREVEKGYAGRDKQQRIDMLYGAPPLVLPERGDDVLMDALEKQGLPREWGLTGKWEDGPTYEQIQAIDAKYKPALDAWVDSLGLRQAKKYLDSIDMKLTGAGRAKKKSLLSGRNLQQSLAVS